MMGGGGGWSGSSTQNSLMQAGIQGAQNTSRQELAQRQMLFQNLSAAMNNNEWLRQHYPNFYGWTPSGGGGGGYEAGANAPTMQTSSNFNMASDTSQQQANAAFTRWQMEQQQKQNPTGNAQSTQSIYSKYGLEY